MKSIGRYGRASLNFLKETYPERYAELSKEEIEEIYTNVNDQALEMLYGLTKELEKNNPVKDTSDFMAVVQHKNQIREMAQEIIEKELLFIKR